MLANRSLCNVCRRGKLHFPPPRRVPSPESRVPSTDPSPESRPESRDSCLGLQGVSKPVRQRSDRLPRRTIRAFGVLAHLVGLAHLLHRARAETNTARRRVDIEDDDLHLVAGAKGLLDVPLSRHAALAERDEAFDARFEL